MVTVRGILGGQLQAWYEDALCFFDPGSYLVSLSFLFFLSS